MKVAQKRVVVSGLIVLVLILLAASFAVGIKVFPTFYDHDILNNSLQEQETLSCNLGQPCSYDRSITLPEDYLVFGDNNSLPVLTVKCISMNDTWEMDSVIGSVDYASGITTNTTNGKMPEDIWTVSTLGSEEYKVTHNFDTQYNISIKGYDLDYDADQRTIWVIGADAGSKFIEEYNITNFQNLTRLNRSDIFFYPIAVHGDFIYAGHTNQNTGKVVKINKYTNELDTIINCDCCPFDKTLKGLETIYGDYLWWVYDNGTYDNIIRTNMNGDCEDDFRLDVESSMAGIGGISFNWANVDNFNVSLLNTIWVADTGQNQFQVWRRGGNPKNVSVTIGSQIFKLIDNNDTFECNAPHDIKISYDILNDEINGSWKIPFYFNLSDMGAIEYSNINIYADNQSFPVKIVYPEPESKHDTTLDVSIFVDESLSMVCSFKLNGIENESILGIPQKGKIEQYTIPPEDMFLEGYLNFSVYCPQVFPPDSDYVSIVYDKSFPLIDFDAKTKASRNTSSGQQSIYVGVVASDATERFTNISLYYHRLPPPNSINAVYKDSVSGMGLRNHSFPVNESGYYFFNATIIDEFNRTNHTSTEWMYLDAEPPILKPHEVDSEVYDIFASANITGRATDDFGIKNATITIYDENNGEIGRYTRCEDFDTQGGTQDCSFVLTYPIHDYGNLSVVTNWTDMRGLSANSTRQYFYVWNEANVTTEISPDSNKILIGKYIVTTVPENTTFELNTSLINLGRGITGSIKAYDANITVDFIGDDLWQSSYTNYTDNAAVCGDVDEECNRTFLVTLSEGLQPGKIYDMFIYFRYKDPSHASHIIPMNLKISVTPDQSTKIIEDYIFEESYHGSNKTTPLTRFYVENIGNGAASSFAFSKINGNLPWEWLRLVSGIKLMPGNILPAQDNESVDVYITIPNGTAPGYYSVNISMESNEQFRDTINITVFVPEDRGWDYYPKSFATRTYPTGTSGMFDNLAVFNSGNINLSFMITDAGSLIGHIDWLPKYPVELLPLERFNFSILYDWYGDSPLSGGTYSANITIQQSNPLPPVEKDTIINVNLQDIPPSIISRDLEQFYALNDEFITTFNITDNLNTSPNVWCEIKKPDNATESVSIDRNFFKYNSYDIYEVNITPGQAGIYNLTVYAWDGVMNITKLTTSFESIAKTFLSVEPEPLIYNATGITFDNFEQFALNVTVNNTGNIKTNLLLVDIIYNSSLFYVEPFVGYDYSLSMDYILNSSDSSTFPFSVTILSKVPPGTYKINPRAQWLNPDSTTPTNQSDIFINVFSNKILSIPEEPINIPLQTNVNASVNFTIKSIGNDKLSNITISCQSGQYCNDFDISFNKTNFDLDAGQDESINVSIYVPYLYDAGTYPIIINTSAEDEALYLFNVTVIDDDRWSISPIVLTASAGANSKGYAGDLTITNIGNMMLFFGLNVSDSSVLNISDNYIYVLKNSSKDVEVYYTAPGTVDTHTFNITVFNETYSTTQNNTEVRIEVINFSVLPISISPDKNILPDDIIHIRAQAYYENNTLDENVNWSVKIGSSDCQVINDTYIVDAWDIFCNAPDLSDGLYYNLDIIGLYEDYNAEYTNTSENAVHYKDITSPVINSTEKEHVINSSNVTLSLNSSDNIDVVDSWVELRYPDSTKINYSMDYINNTYEIELESLGVGDYDIIYYTNDSGGNIASKQDWFEVYIPINFSGDVRDADNIATNTVFRLYRPETDTLLYEFVSNTTEGFNLTQDQIHKRVYDINITVSAVDIELFNVSVDETTLNPIDIDNVEGEEVIDIALHKPLVGIGVVNNFTINGYYRNYTAAENETEYGIVNGYVTIHYNGTVYSDENSITVFKCPDWDYYSRNCQSSWIEQNKTLDVVANTIKVKIDSFSGYMAAENRCGNGVCEIAYAETTTTCSLDCKPAPSTIISSGGGGGGGISRRTLEDALAKFNQSFNVSAGTEMGFNISKEIKAALESPMQIQGVKVATTSIYRELFPGERLSTGIILRNVREDSTVDINARAVGTIKDFIVFQNETVRLKPLQEMNFGITIAADVFTMAGSYEGSIILESGGRSLQIPVSIRVQEKTEKLLDMKIQPLTNTISPGEDLRLQIDIYNLGKTARVDINLAYQLVDVHTEEIITEKQESLAIETTLSQIRSLHIPEDLRLGNYLVRGISSYSSFNKTIFASSLAYVTVAKPWYLYELFGVIPVWIIMSILMFVALNGAMFWGYKQYEAKKKRYRIALDLKELPQPGERTAYIGQVAETSIRTFLEIDKMQTHTIVAGSTGGGKTVAAQVLVEEALKNNVSVIVFDPTAQWTGFLRPCKERRMLKYYPKFQMKQKQAQAFNGNIHHVEDAREIIDIKKFMKPGEINIFSINKLKLQDIDIFVANTIREIFELNLDESPNLKLIIVYDEVHRLLPKFGGSGEGFIQIERACREFRKWGVGLLLISQVLSDFIGSIKANINTEVQVKTRDEGDLDRIKTKYGEDMMKSIVKASVGTAMLQNSAYNKGRPYFVGFRPLLHSITRLSDDELEKYQKFNEKIEDYECQMDQLEQEKVDVFGIRLELKLAFDKLKVGKFSMVNIYLEGIEPRLKKHWDKLGRQPKKKEIQLAKVTEIQKAVKEAEKARKKFEKEDKKAAVPTESEEETEEAKPMKKKPVKERKEAKPRETKQIRTAAKPEKPEAPAIPKKETAVKAAKTRPAEELEDRYNQLQNKLSEKRKKGMDTSIIEIDMRSIPADIKMFTVMEDNKIRKKIEKKMADIEKKLK